VARRLDEPSEPDAVGAALDGDPGHDTADAANRTNVNAADETEGEADDTRLTCCSLQCVGQVARC
jgi:hypothetical protein